MSRKEKIISPSLGGRLRELRQKKGIGSVVKLSAVMKGKYSPEVIWKRESGKTKIDFEYVDAFSEALNLNNKEREFLQRAVRSEMLRKEGNFRELTLEYSQLRVAANNTEMYTANLVPAGLQTFNYAKKILEAYGDTDNFNEWYQKRVNWNNVCLADSSKKVRLAFSENALYTPIGSREIMVEQLQRLLQFEEAHNFEFRILPNTIFLQVPIDELFAVFDGAYCFCETQLGIVTSEEPAAAKRLTKIFEEIWAKALFGVRRAKLIEKAVAYFKLPPVF